MIRYFAISTLTLFMCAAAAAQTNAGKAAAPNAGASGAPNPAAPPVTNNAAPPAAAGAFKGDASKGRELTRMCEGCHGIEGWRTAFPEVYHVPKLGGQHAAYIAQALHEYRSGDRSHPSMRAIAGSLTDEDIANLAAYYAQGSPQTTTASK